MRLALIKGKSKSFLMLSLLCFVIFAFPARADDQSQLIMTVSPPLFKVNISPGEIWKSTVKVVNNNSEKIEIYAQVLDFKSGEDGGVVFLDKPTDEDQTKIRLSQWIDVGQGPVEIPAQESREIPFVINVPNDASPGGHYAAILTGTKPVGESEGSALKISSLIASLVMVTVNGEIIEEGKIREFSTDRFLYNDPDVKFKVRFENTGNAHLQPQGEIVISDMFGKTKKRIEINQKTDFGNVLPQSTRRWDFAWSEKGNLLSMGRYKANLILTYGENGRDTASQAVLFWVIDFKLIGSVAGGTILFIILFFWLIKRYIRRAVLQTQIDAGLIPSENVSHVHKVSVIPSETKKYDQIGVKPLINLNRVKKVRGISFIRRHYRMLLILAFVVFCGVALTLVLSVKEISGGKSQKSTVQTQKDLGSVRDEPSKSDIGMDTADSASGQKTNGLKVALLSGNGLENSTEKMMITLQQEGFLVESGNADSADYKTTVIKYRPEFEKEAVKIRTIFAGMVEMSSDKEIPTGIVVILGKDYSAK